ncbi:ubiquitin carboxyl-terminal hydrolase isozyme L1 [Pyrenophora tritici-repentis]|uniref:Ubiquitin carboxyl-terminal hydrolase n=1 Tax=Pyrenophora tritici-repentis TaxID=45151 RepID=A0A2W1CMW1_9PLEO|nr:Ubiquitin carboxyl-terminal hydrolase [Pyrenophora tritici-repentis]KAF7452480.1 Ubiquitin carboxyl-terminal hydrolase [Pyrenophora tritici-repentis]KAF7574394.1 ubiquitin carboxyl-terminal hydrolase isozyme L1 [Pyrenophora tritici-repentis]KAI0569013.1 Ubiquitin carboxyl-terminal hydrolase [Pyrenophora tritici-repentis]KAI0569279.1 Ubiquitin carboxyl-terminal hydrolase [Pyrenophora tritici-repentis]
MFYKKHFLPLESNPELFTELLHRLGFSKAFSFHDVLSIDDPELLAFIPRPALALVLVFPTTTTYEKHKKDEEETMEDYAKSGLQEEVIWYKQTINNACGLYGILHAVSNGDARDFAVQGSHLHHLLEKCEPLGPFDRANVLENDTELESAYREVATQGSSQVPANAEDEVDFHYVCFVKSNENGHLYELDGDRKGPKDRGPLEPDEDVLSDGGRKVIKEFIEREQGQNTNFSLLALAPT